MSRRILFLTEILLLLIICSCDNNVFLDEPSPIIRESIEYHPHVPATCTESGTEQYWTDSSVPGLYFLNKERTRYTTDLNEITTSPLGHDVPTGDCRFDGDYHWRECFRCHEYFDFEVHGFEIVFTADQETRTLLMNSFCSVCGKEYVNTKPSNTGAFDVSVSDGITAVRTEPYANSWVMAVEETVVQRYSRYNCSWFVSGSKIDGLVGTAPFTFSCDIDGDDTVLIYCEFRDGRGSLKEVCTVQISR